MQGVQPGPQCSGIGAEKGEFVFVAGSETATPDGQVLSVRGYWMLSADYFFLG